MEVLANINGRISSPNDARVSVLDRGFLFGDGVYETGRSYDRHFLFLEEHIQRLRRSAERLGIEIPWSDGELESQLIETARQFGKDNIYFRMIVTRGEVNQIGLDVSSEKPNLVILVQDLSSQLGQLRTKGYYLLTSSVRRNSSQAQDPNIKSSNYLNSILALKDVKGRGAMDAVLLNSEGWVTEGTTFSVFSVGKDGVLRTPSLAVGILDGITRRHILQIAQGNLKCEEGSFALSDFQNADEVFIASSVREICPVYQWDQTHYSAPGKVTSFLQNEYQKMIQKIVKGQKSF